MTPRPHSNVVHVPLTDEPMPDEELARRYDLDDRGELYCQECGGPIENDLSVSCGGEEDFYCSWECVARWATACAVLGDPGDEGSTWKIQEVVTS